MIHPVEAVLVRKNNHIDIGTERARPEKAKRENKSKIESRPGRGGEFYLMEDLVVL